MDLQPGASHFHNLVSYLHNVRKSDFIESFRQSNSAEFRHGPGISFRSHLQQMLPSAYLMRDKAKLKIGRSMR
jgi:hypothetical protein